jgi:two-component system response regulator HydG
MVEQAVALVQNGVIMADDLLPPVSSRTPLGSPQSGGRALADVVDSAERAAIDGALHESGGSRERAAELLGISPTTLWRKMTRLGIVWTG